MCESFSIRPEKCIRVNFYLALTLNVASGHAEQDYRIIAELPLGALAKFIYELYEVLWCFMNVLHLQRWSYSHFKRFCGENAALGHGWQILSPRWGPCLVLKAPGALCHATASSLPNTSAGGSMCLTLTQAARSYTAGGAR